MRHLVHAFVVKESPNGIDYSDKVPFADQLSNIQGDEIDIILETPGGIAEVVEDLVKLIRSWFERVGVLSQTWQRAQEQYLPWQPMKY